MRNPRTVDILCQIARKAAQGDTPGTALFGDLALAYYPISERFTWFLDGERITKKEAIKWLTSPSGEQTTMTPIGKHWQRWDELETAMLKEMAAKHMTVHQIARKLGRTPAALVSKSYKLGIPLTWRKKS
jgi:hypothetical protein